MIRENTRVRQEMNRTKELNKRLEQTLKDSTASLDAERNLSKSLSEELEKSKESFNRLTDARRQVELEENKVLLNSTKRRAENLEKDVENLRNHARKNEKIRSQLEMKVNRLKEDLNVLRQGVKNGDVNMIPVDVEGDGRKSALHYFCAAAKNKKDLSRLVEHKFSKFYCTVCESSLKDTVLSTCYHTFCYSCVDKNLKTRHRKCALCNLPFGRNDVHKLY